MGYKTYIPVLEPINKKTSIIIDENDNILENKYFKLQINKLDGTLSSLIDKQNNREIVSQDSEEGFGQYFLEQPGHEIIDVYNKAYIKSGAEGWANN